MRNNGFKTYDVFFSHSGFPEITELLRKKVEKVGAPPWRFKNLRAFLDLNDTRAGELLPQSISEAIENSKYFLLLASKAAAQSTWVAKEVGMWLKSNPASRILIVVLEGRVKWDEERNDFDWTATNCLPKILSGKYSGEPSRAILEHISPGNLTKVDDQRLRQTAASVAAQILGVSRDTILDTDRTWWRRTIAGSVMVIGSLILSMVLLVSSIIKIRRIPADQHYQNGQTLIGQRSKFQHIRDGLDEIKEALVLDPNHQEALLAKAFALTLLVGYGGSSNPAQAHEEAEQALAHVKDKTTSEYYHIKGRLVLFKDRKPSAALPLLKTAVRLDPDNVEARHSLANNYSFLREHKQAEALCLQAIDIAFRLSGGKSDKRFVRSKALLAWTYYHARDYQRAEELSLKILEIDDPSYELANRYLGQIYIQRGEYKKAVDYFERAGGDVVGNPNLYANLTAALALGGQRQEAYDRIQNLLERGDAGEYVSHYRLAQCYASLGETHKALNELRLALDDKGDAFVLWSAVDPLLSSLHGLKEFDEYLKSLDLSDFR